jgi:DNA-binding CsgD family transcriptional regulator/PAS domain-containing protein
MARATRYDDATLLQLVDTLYDVADDLERWPEFLAELLEITGSHSAVIRRTEVDHLRDWPVVAHPLNMAIVESYYRDFAHSEDNPWLLPQVLARVKPGTVLTLSELIPDEDLHQSAYYQKFMRPNGWGDHVMLVFDGQADSLLSLTLCGSEQDERYGDADVAFLTRLAPHLSRAFRIYSMFSEAAGLKRSVEEIVERVPVGLLLFDSAGKMVLANRRARDILDARDCIRLDKSGAPCGPSAEQTDKIRRSLAQATGTSSDSSLGRASCLALERSGAEQPVAALFTPFRPGSETCLGEESGFAAIFLSAPEHRLNPPEQVLQDMCGLTPTEARLATFLVAGLSLEEVSVEMTISLNTARTHLKRIYKKTATHRQGALVSLVVNLVGAVNGPAPGK